LSIILLTISLHLLFAGMTTDTTNLIYLSSFIGILIAVIAGEILYLTESSMLIVPQNGNRPLEAKA
jgi:succinate-acetate transporter protein